MKCFLRLRQLRAAALVAAAVVVCLLPAKRLIAQQQPPTLADIAKKEAERRNALKKTGKVYTKEDLPKNAKPVALPPAAPPAAAEAKAAEVEKPKEDEKDENWWRGRITAVREELRRNQMFMDALQSRINALAADFSSRDDPVQRARIGEDRNKAILELERVMGEGEALKKQIADIEEEGRVAGVPPGWLR
jgi:hypothetical protein